jgi:hypothetical protein
VLPGTLVFQTSKEPLNHRILLGRIWRDELLLQPIVSTGLARRSAALENQPRYRCVRPALARLMSSGLRVRFQGLAQNVVIEQEIPQSSVSAS